MENINLFTDDELIFEKVAGYIRRSEPSGMVE